MKTANLQEIKSIYPGINKTLEQLTIIAFSHNGKCLSSVYKNIKQKLLWECKKGHQWYATPFSIKVRKSWCPVCAGNQPLGMKAMHESAKENEGKCLSTEYGNCKTKMLWQCSNGHQFQSTPENVKLGRWCPHCYSKIAK
jgi:hypothetical protein